jgi:hypothetical protein
MSANQNSYFGEKICDFKGLISTHKGINFNVNTLAYVQEVSTLYEEMSVCGYSHV